MKRKSRPRSATRSTRPPPALADAVPALGGTLDAARIARDLADLARARLAADAVAVWLLEHDGAALVLEAESGLAHAGRVARLPVAPAGGLDGWLAPGAGPRVLHRLSGAVPPGARAWLGAEAIVSLLVVPLLHEERALGLLAAFRRGQRRFSRAALARASALALPAGPAFHAARRYAAEVERARRIEVLLTVAQTLGATPDLAAALEDISRAAGRALDAERCVIDLRPPGGGPRAATASDTALVVPLLFKDAVVGTMTVTAPGGRRWEPGAIDLATAIAGQIALAAENAHLYREAKSQASELAALREVGRTLTSSLDLSSVLEAIADAAVALIGARRCAVHEIDPAEGLLRFRAGRRLPDQSPATSLRLGQGVAGTAALTRAPVFNPDVVAHPPPLYDRPAPGADGGALGDVVRALGMRAILSVPLVSKETVLGVISVYWDEIHARDEREVRLLTGLAQQAAVAIEHARLHGASVRRAEELAALLRATRTVMAGADTKAVLDQIVHEAAAIAGTPYVSLLIVDAATSRLRVGALSGRPLPPDCSVPLGAGYSGTVARTGAPLFAGDTQNDPDNLLAAHDREVGVQTYLGLPVKTGDTVLGVLTFGTTGPRRYGADELSYLASFADQTAIALDKARLYEDAQRAVTDLKAVQQALVQGETLRAVGELAGGAAHHLNNLLTIVVGRVQLLRRTVEEERVQRPLEIIERAARDGAEVVRRLQQFSGMRRIAQPKLVDVNEIVTDVLEMTRGRWQDAARAQGIEVTVHTRLDELPEVPGDAAGLRELLTNLVLNAVDAMPAGGRLTVATRRQDGGVALTVADDGIGMTEEIRLRAHEPFFTTKGVKSTGLGLSVSYGIVRRHDGELSIESEPGHGTTITVLLPLSAAPAPAPPAPPAPPGPARRFHILLVDDETPVRDALADMLATDGHRVLTAASGREALARLAAEPAVDLVLTDLVMPGMTGWEVASEVKRRRPALPVGVITGWGDLPEPTESTRSAIDFVIGKPVTVEALNDAVASLGRG